MKSIGDLISSIINTRCVWAVCIQLQISCGGPYALAVTAGPPSWTSARAVEVGESLVRNVEILLILESV